jgi:hypothetical protein
MDVQNAERIDQLPLDWSAASGLPSPSPQWGNPPWSPLAAAGLFVRKG